MRSVVYAEHYSVEAVASVVNRLWHITGWPAVLIISLPFATLTFLSALWAAFLHLLGKKRRSLELQWLLETQSMPCIHMKRFMALLV